MKYNFLIILNLLISINLFGQKSKIISDSNVKSVSNDLNLSDQNSNLLYKKDKNIETNTQSNLDVSKKLNIDSTNHKISDFQRKIFGYELFFNRELNFNPSSNFPTPLNYVIGPGDLMLIDIYGATHQTYNLKINGDGKLFFPKIGPVDVGNLSISAAKSRITNALGRIYSGLLGENPTSFLDVRLGSIKTVSISIIGEVNNPGTYLVSSFSSPINALFFAGGPTEKGSFRNVNIYRDNKLLETVDIYNFLLNGNLGWQKLLRDNDIIIVPPVSKRIEIKGPVKREGIYEVRGNETVQDLISFAGGFKSYASKQRVRLNRIINQKAVLEEISQDKYASTQMFDGDLIFVESIIDKIVNRVTVNGAVYRPAEYSLEPQMRVKDLIIKAGGLKKDAFLNRAILYRLNNDNSNSVIELNLFDTIKGDSLSNIYLHSDDVLNITSENDLKEIKYVEISGEVNVPSVYDFSENMTVEDLIIKSGGFKESASISKVEVSRRNFENVYGVVSENFEFDISRDLKVSNNLNTFKLRPFDHVRVRKSSNFIPDQVIKMDGELVYPGEFSIKTKSDKISDLVLRAGGITRFGFPEGAALYRFRGKKNIQVESDSIKLNKLKLLLSNYNKTKFSINKLDSSYSQSIKEMIDKLSNSTNVSKVNIDSSTNVSLENRSNRFTGEYIINNDYRLDPNYDKIGINLIKALKNPGSLSDLIVKDGDILFVPSKLETVSIKGAVFQNLSTRYIPGKTLRYYISSSGGVLFNADRSKIYVSYANGDIKQTKNLLFMRFFPKIKAGAEIYIPLKSNQPKSLSQFVNSTTGLISSVLTMYFLINSIK